MKLSFVLSVEKYYSVSVKAKYVVYSEFKI